MDNVFSGSGYSEDLTSVNEEDNIMYKMREVKDNVNKQAVAIKDRLNEHAGQMGNQLAQKIDNARGKTSSRLRNTSQKLHNLAIYVEEHNARDMSKAALRSTRDAIRKHPGRSIVIGIIAGLLLGRALRAFRA